LKLKLDSFAIKTKFGLICKKNKIKLEKRCNLKKRKVKQLKMTKTD